MLISKKKKKKCHAQQLPFVCCASPRHRFILMSKGAREDIAVLLRGLAYIFFYVFSPLHLLAIGILINICSALPLSLSFFLVLVGALIFPFLDFSHAFSLFLLVLSFILIFFFFRLSASIFHHGLV